MKKILLIIGSLLLFLAISLPIASAKTLAPKLPDVLPQDIDILFEMNTSVDNPIDTWLVENFKLIAEFNEEMEAKKTLMIEELLANNHFTLAMNFDTKEPDPLSSYNYNDPQIFLSFYVKDENLAETLDLFESEYEIATYKEQNVYLIMQDTVVIHLDGLLIITTSSTLAEEMIDNYLDDKAETLANSSIYLESGKYQTENPFFEMFINPSSFMLDEENTELGSFRNLLSFGLSEMDFDYMSTITGETIAVSKQQDGFELSLYVEGDKAKLEELDLMFNKYNFVPDLYKDISGKDIIFFSEMNDLNRNLEDTLATFDKNADLNEMYEEFTDWFTEETSKDFDTEVLPLFTGKNMIAVHNTNGLYPAITVIFDVNGNKKAATDLTKEVSDLLRNNWETQEKEEKTEFYINRVTTIENSEYYHHELNLAAMEEDENLADLPQEATMLTLTMGVSTDGMLLFSTHPNLKGIYKSKYDMTDNATFNELYTANGEDIAGLAFMDFDELNDYLAYIYELTDETQETKDLVSGLLEPWHQLFMITYAEENKSWSLATLKAETEGYDKYGTFLSELMFSDLLYDYENDFDYDYDFPLEELNLVPGPSEFCDINDTDWFAFYIKELSYLGFITGYNDGCFRPANDITRAEFTKLVIEAAEYLDMFIPVAMSDADIYYSDVPSNEWYWHYINQASANGFVNGYEDGTFHPNAPISRAEAVQIIYNVYDSWYEYDQSLQTANEPFTDVNESDWFYNAVNYAYTNDVVSGASPTTFEPNRNINRAEASKIIYNMVY